MRNRGYEYYEEPRGWSAFMAGTLIGAGVALLFAPKSGAARDAAELRFTREG
jgi:hypothetical protein